MERIRVEAHIPIDTKVTYAGRLDPIASGLVIFLVGDFRFNKETYSKLSKTYEVEFFLGYSTDTYDILGISTRNSVPHPNPPLYKGGENTNNFSINLETFLRFQPLGEFEQVFPPYSSRRVAGKSLFQYAREQNSDIPEISHKVTLYGINDYSVYEINSNELLLKIKNDISTVVGDFRQEESIESWKQSLSESEIIQIHKLSLSVSSGFYVRQWINDLGLYLSTDIVTFSINRVTIDMFNMSMLNGESFHIFYETDPILNNLTK